METPAGMTEAFLPTDWIRYENLACSGKNMQKYNHGQNIHNEEVCKMKCITNPDCMSYEFREGRNCQISKDCILGGQMVFSNGWTTSVLQPRLKPDDVATAVQEVAFKGGNTGVVTDLQLSEMGTHGGDVLSTCESLEGTKYCKCPTNSTPHFINNGLGKCVMSPSAWCTNPEHLLKPWQDTSSGATGWECVAPPGV